MVDTQETRFLPALADAVREWFPEVGTRSFAVSESTITKENVPTLPLVMVAFMRGTSEQLMRSSSESFEIVDNFVIEFWLEPARYKRANGTETPFWSYYNYEKVRKTLLDNLARWPAPHCEQIAYKALAINATPLAVTLTFGFSATRRYVAEVNDLGEPFEIGFCLTPDETCIPDPCEILDPCL